MSEQKVSNERKKELEQLDPFQEKIINALNFLNTYKKQCLMGLAAVIAVIIVFSSVMYSIQKSEDTAALMVSRALAEYGKIQDPEKAYLEVKDDFQTVFKEYANTAAGKQARVKFAKICYEASQFDQSLTHYKEALDLFKNQALMENFLLASLGHVCIAKKDYPAAESYFKQIEKTDTNLLKDEAGYALALLYEASDKKAESRKMYEKIVSDYKDSIYLPFAKSKIQ